MDMGSRRLDLFFTQALTGLQAIKALTQFIVTFRVTPGCKIFSDLGSDLTSKVSYDVFSSLLTIFYI